MSSKDSEKEALEERVAELERKVEALSSGGAAPSRRQLLGVGGLLGAGSVLGLSGVTADSAAAQTAASYDRLTIGDTITIRERDGYEGERITFSDADTGVELFDVDRADETVVVTAANGVWFRQGALKDVAAIDHSGLTGGKRLENIAGENLRIDDDGNLNVSLPEEPDEVIHLDYDDYDSWDDIYRMSNGDPDNLSLVSSPTASGESALQLRAREGGHWGLSTHYDFDGLHEINGRVLFALDSDWEMNGDNIDTCRLWNCAIARGDSNAGGDGPPDGSDEAGWSNRMYVSSKGTSDSGPFNLKSYTYHMDQQGGFGDEIHTETEPIVPGRWHEFEYYVKVNTIENGEAQSDGVIRYWLDGEQVHEWTGLRFRNDPDNLIDTTGPAVYYGGNETAPKNLYAYYDEHSMALNGTFDAAE